MDTLPSGELQSGGFRSALAVSGFRFRARLGFSIPSSLSGQRGITPAFGYGAPHPSARGTSTLLNNALLSAHYEPRPTPRHRACGPFGFCLLPPTVPLVAASRCRGLPVLVHVVSQRARGLRLRRADQLLALSPLAVLPSPSVHRVGALELVLRSSIPGPPMPLSTLRPRPHDRDRKTRGQDGSLLLSCRTLSFLATCRLFRKHSAADDVSFWRTRRDLD